MKKLAILMALALSLAGASAATSSDPRPLSHAETATFFALVCAAPIAHDKLYNCRQAAGYPGIGSNPEPSQITFDAIVYGAFTKPGADQAYVSYSASFEPHATGFGGGILFVRRAGAWKLVRWYPGGQMADCVALPPAGTQSLLCLSSYMGQGEIDSSVWLNRVPDSDADGAFAAAAIAILKAQDDRDAASTDYQCTLKRAPSDAILLSVDHIKRSGAPGILAEAVVSYATARDVAAACRAKSFADVKTVNGVVRFRLAAGKVVADTPVPFAAPDY